MLIRVQEFLSNNLFSAVKFALMLILLTVGLNYKSHGEGMSRGTAQMAGALMTGAPFVAGIAGMILNDPATGAFAASSAAFAGSAYAFTRGWFALNENSRAYLRGINRSSMMGRALTAISFPNYFFEGDDENPNLDGGYWGNLFYTTLAPSLTNALTASTTYMFGGDAESISIAFVTALAGGLAALALDRNRAVPYLTGGALDLSAGNMIAGWTNILTHVYGQTVGSVSGALYFTTRMLLNDGGNGGLPWHQILFQSLAVGMSSYTGVAAFGLALLGLGSAASGKDAWTNPQNGLRFIIGLMAANTLAFSSVYVVNEAYRMSSSYNDDGVFSNATLAPSENNMTYWPSLSPSSWPSSLPTMGPSAAPSFYPTIQDGDIFVQP